MKKARKTLSCIPVSVKPQGPLGRFLDLRLKWLMYAVQGNKNEEPQRTHLWNNFLLKPSEAKYLKTRYAVCVKGDLSSGKRYSFGFIALFHLPVFGGWKKFVVLVPKIDFKQGWFIGWITKDDKYSMSCISLYSPVRMLVGPEDVLFFGVDLNGKQIPLLIVDFGEIGTAGKYSDYLLL